MKLTFTKLAMIGAVALTFAVSSQEAQAQCAVTTAVTFDAEVPETMNICATIDNTFTTQVTDIDFGVIGATNSDGSGGATDTPGCLLMLPTAAGVIDESNASCGGVAVTDGRRARIVSSTGTGTLGLIDILPNGAFVDQEVRLQFDVLNRTMTCAGDGVAPDSAHLLIHSLTSDQGTTAASWVWDTDLTTSNENAVIGADDTADSTDPLTAGSLAINIGAEIWTDGTGDVYESGTCQGSFNVTLFY